MKLAPAEAKLRAGEITNRQWVAEVNKQLAASVMSYVQQNLSLSREQMVPAFGDVGFGLKVGEIGLAPFDPKTSPFGIHVIKRLQ